MGTVRIGFNQSSLDEALRESRRHILKLAATATALAIIGTVLIVGWITRPLPLLAAAAREVGKGHFGVKVAWNSADEVGMLARAFNEMAHANSILFKSLGEESEKLASVFNATQEGLVLTESDGHIALINPSARALLGCQERSVATIQNLLEPEHKSTPELAEIFKSQSRITPVEFERREPKLLILSGVADRLGEGKKPAGFLFIFHDATLEKKAEVLSRNFLSLVTHKLRTPLAVALGYLEIVQGEGGNLTADQRTSLSKVASENEKLRRLVEKLITFSSVQSPENIVLVRAPAAPAEIVDLAIKALSGIIDDSVELRWDPAACKDLPKPEADVLLLKEVLANLIENAAKFNPSKKKLVAIAATEEDGAIKISVKDNGPGIPGEEQGKLFHKFYQIEEHFTGQIPGLGLGLAFVKNVVEAHGGRVGVRSTVGDGSEFYFTLPILGKG